MNDISVRKVESLEHYKALVKEARQSGYTLTNCFLMPGAVRELTSKGFLFFYPVEEGLLLLEDCDCFYRCSYYLSENDLRRTVRFDKDAVLEFPFSNEMNEKQRMQADRILKMGFSLGRESSVMEAAPQELVKIRESKSLPQVVFAQIEDAEQILSMIRETFDPLYAFLPDREEIEQLIENEEVFVIHNKNGDGEVLAALISSYEKTVAGIRQVAVAKAGRGMGMGSVLLNAYHSHYMEKASAFRHWVSLDNAAAISMYRRFGYHFGFRKANEYIILHEKGVQK